MIVEFTRSFDQWFSELPVDLQKRSHDTIAIFLDSYTSRQFPKGLRVYKCGAFLSLSVTMKYRIFVLPITGGVRFVFVGDHHTADRYLKK